MKNQTKNIAVTLMSLIVMGVSSNQRAVAQDKITFDDHVKPIMMQRCSSCHNGQRTEGDLDVTNYTNLMQGGGSGAVIEPQDSGASYLYKLITHEDSPEMPPSGTKIPDPEIQMIAKWIDMGALENKGSKAAKAKPKLDMALSESPTAKPEVMPMPLRMPLEPVIRTKRPSVTAMATSPWAPILAVGSPKQILLFNTQTLKLAGVIPLGDEISHALKFSRNGQLLLSGGGKDGAAGRVTIFSAITGEVITTIGEELDAVLAADISPSHEYVALGGPSKLVKLYSIDGELIAEIKKHTEWVTAMEFSPDGKYLATGDRNGGLHVWEADSGNEVYTLKAHTQAISGISWRSDSRFLASCSEDTNLRVWDATTGKQIKGWRAHGNGATSVEYLRNGNIVSCGRDKVSKVWSQDGKQLRQFPGMPDVGIAVSYCDEADRAICADWTSTIRVWNGPDGKEIGKLVANPPTLGERVQWTQGFVAKANEKHKPLQEQVAQTKAKVDGLMQSLTAAKQTQVQVQGKLTQSEQQFAATKKQFDSTSAQHAQWRKELDEKQKAVPLMTESLAKATAASQALATDEELKKTVQALKAKLDQLNARAKELGGLVAKSDQEKNTTKTQMDQLASAVAAAKSEMNQVGEEIKKLEGAHATTSQTLAQQTKAAAEAKAGVDRAMAELTRWKNEVAFVGQLSSLKQQLKTQEELVAQKQSVVEAAHQKLAEAQKVVDEAVKQRTEASNQAKSLADQIQKLRSTQ